MNASKIFQLATSFYNAANDTHMRSIATGKQSTAPINGVTIFATMFYGDGPRRYSIKGYRLPGEKQRNFEMSDWIAITPAALDDLAKATGYYLTNLPEGYTHRLIYRQIENPEMPPIGYTTEGNQKTAVYNKRAREAAIMAAGQPQPGDLIEIVNVKGMVPNLAGIHYCGRKSGGWRPGVLANPHIMVTEDDRQTVIDLFRSDLDDDIARQGAMYQRLRQIQARVEEGYNVTLGCWCAPQACHCDVIKEKVIWLMTAQPNAPRLHSQQATNTAEPTVRRPGPVNVLAAGEPAPSAPHPNDEPEPAPATPTIAKRFNLVVAIGGDLADYGIVSEALDAAMVKMIAACTTLVLHAPAVNEHLARWTAAHGDMSVTMHKADWVNGGPTAQAQRDEKMLKAVDGLLVIWNGEEGRIADLVKLATNKRLPVRDIRYGKPAPAPVTPAPEPTPVANPNNVYRLIVAGGRNFANYDMLARTLDESAAKLASKGKTLMVVCGMAKGADMLGKEWADNNHMPVDKHPADWNTHGKVAGYRRNEEMAQVADGAIVFWDGISRGSKHMIETAEKKGLPVKVVKYAPAPVNIEAPPEPEE